MSDNLNVAEGATIDHELISCVESINSNKTDCIFTEAMNSNNCINNSMDISQRIENCEQFNSIVLTDTNNINNKELVVNVVEQNDHNLRDVDIENALDQINIDATCSMDNEPAIPDVENKLMVANNAIEVVIDQADQITGKDMTDLSTIDVFKPITNNGINDFADEAISKETACNESKMAYENCSIHLNENNQNENNVILNPDIYQEQEQQISEPEKTLIKTSSRPQRQAAKKAENQIREIAKEIIKPIDSIDEIVIDTIEMLSSPLKKVCCQCNRFRLCKFTAKDHKSMYLCQEECVDKYRRKNDQYNFEKNCEQCLSVISKNDDKSYYWQTKHFCSVECLSNYQNTVFDSNCINCQKLIKSDADLGKFCRYISGKILQFCGVVCVENYENMLSLCSFCQKELVDNHFEKFCSSFCQTKDYESRKKHIEPNSSVNYNSNDTSQVVDRCKVCFCKLNSSSTNRIQICSNTDTLFQFCSNECNNKFIISKKRTVSCSLCKIKKFSFDMISTKNGFSNSPTYICSLYCLHRLELPQSKSKKVICDKCGLLSQARYKAVYIATTYNFCSQNCLNLFQSTKKQKSKSKNEKQSSTTRISTRQSARKEDNLSDSDGVPNFQQKTSKVKKKVSRKISYEDTNVLSKVDKEVQTDQTGSKGVIIPVPVPVYIPMPMHMYVRPYPVPVPLPIPLPIPIFIPTTKNTTKGIFKDIKKIREETPSDPFEAELLLMAGMVADDQKNENSSSSDSENDVSNNDYNDDTKIVSSSARSHNSFGDDVLAMAFNMAGADTENLEGPDELSTITSNNQANQIIDDVEANLVSSTIMPQIPDPMEDITQENMISSPQDMLRRPPRKRAPRTQSQHNSNFKRSRKNEYPQVPCTQSSAGLIQQPLQNPLYSMPMSIFKPDANMCLKYTLGVNAWRQWAATKSIEFEKTLSNNTCGVNKTNIFKLDLLQLTASELNYCLCLFVKEVRKPNGNEYAPDTIYYLCLGVQQYLFENGRIDNIFTDISYEKFTDTLNEVAIKFTELYNDTKFIVTRVEEEYLWESKQLGAHSPYVLLCTLIFFNTKHFNLTCVEEHMQLSFSHIMKHWKRNPNQPSTSGVKAPGTYRNVLLRFYPPQASIDSPNSRKKKVYEQHENEENPLRCPVKLYEFYLSKCPESVKTRNDLFYLTPERSCVPDSPVWYSTCTLNKESLEKMLNRVKMVKEINVALLSS